MDDQDWNGLMEKVKKLLNENTDLKIRVKELIRVVEVLQERVEMYEERYHKD